MTAWLMAHGPIPSFQKYLLEPARLSSPGLVYGKYAQEAVSLTEKYRGVLRICPWTNSVIWMDLEWSGYISAQRDVSLFFFRCSWVSLIFSSWSKPSEKESMVLSWHLVEMRLSSIVIGCSIINHPFWGTSGTSIYGNPQICWNIRPLDVSEEGGGTSAAYHFLEKAEGQKFPLPGSAICHFQICHGLSRQLS